MLVVNLFGGPGVGKSTIAAELFALLKRKRLSVELVTEYAKDLVWENRSIALSNQAHILGNQFHRMWRLKQSGNVDYLVTDSPILLSVIYAQDQWPGFKEFALGLHSSLYNFNVRLLRDLTSYVQAGRLQTEDEARLLDMKIDNLLVESDLEYTILQSDNQTASKILEKILR